MGRQQEQSKTERRGYDWEGRKCVTSQIRLRNLCMKFTGGLVSLGVGARHAFLRIKQLTDESKFVYRIY